MDACRWAREAVTRISTAYVAGQRIGEADASRG